MVAKGDFRGLDHDWAGPEIVRLDARVDELERALERIDLYANTDGDMEYLLDKIATIVRRVRPTVPRSNP